MLSPMPVSDGPIRHGDSRSSAGTPKQAETSRSTIPPTITPAAPMSIGAAASTR